MIGRYISRFTLLLSVAMLSSVSVAQAAAFDGVNSLTQAQLDSLGKDLGATFSHKSNGPAYALGLTGFEIGASAGVATLANSAIYDKANPSSKSISDVVSVSSLYAVKGLPFGFDVGASLRNLGGYGVYGVDARYSILDGGILTPSVVARIAHTEATDSSKLSFSANSADISVSKGFLFVVPYAGVGTVASDVSTSLLKSNNTQSRVFAGINANFLLMSLGYEYDKTGDVASHGLKLSLKW